MTDEELKPKYQYLRNEMYSIRSKLNNLSDDYNTMKKAISNNMSIDGEMPGEDVLSDVKKSVNNIVYEINNSLLPRINRKT